MKFIDKIIELSPDNRIHWLWKPNINKYIDLLNISYKDAIIKYYNYENTVEDILEYYNKKKKYPLLFIFVNPSLDISFYRTLITIKDGIILYNKKIIFYNIPHVFVISDRKPVAKILTVHRFSTHFMSDKR